MTTSYQYSLTTDFTNASQVETSILQQTIKNDTGVVIEPSYINTDGDIVDIFFPSALSGAQKTALDGLISAYVYSPLYIPKSTVYQAVVGPTGDEQVDYTSISAAFAAGNSSVYVKSGTYVETSDIVIPNWGQLVGELPAKTVIYFAGAYSIKVDGSGGVVNTTGTLSITNNTKVITGSGTSFTTNILTGWYILLGTNYYEIATVDSDTQITLKELYMGRTLSGENVRAQSMYTGCSISNFIITNSSSYGIDLRGIRHGNMRSIAILKCGLTFRIRDCADMSLKDMIISHSLGHGIELDNVMSFSLNVINVFNSASNGIDISNSSNIVIEASASENNSGYGINIANSDLINISNCIIKNNASCCISAVSGCNHININNTECSKSIGNGVNVSGNNNVIAGCNIIENTGNGINCQGNKSRILGNSIDSNTSVGLRVSGDSNVINCNVINNSGGNGVEFVSGGDNNIFTNNNSTVNTGTNIVDSGAGNILANNIST